MSLGYFKNWDPALLAIILIIIQSSNFESLQQYSMDSGANIKYDEKLVSIAIIELVMSLLQRNARNLAINQMNTEVTSFIFFD